jgi:GNAT superfamily N-acetyltransferase
MLETAIAAARQHEQSGERVTRLIDETNRLLLTIEQGCAGWFMPNVNLRLHRDDGNGTVGEFDAWFCNSGVRLWHHEIEPAHRRQGHGTRLVATIQRYIQLVRPAMKRAVHCFTDQADTTQLLLACGFHEQEPRVVINGKTHVGLARLIEPIAV